MDKKLLVSFMMTAPVAAFGAQSNWMANGSGNLSYSIEPQANADNWQPNGLAEFTTSGDILRCPVSAGFLTHNAVLPAGKYSFNCSHLSNALIKVNGKYLAKTNAAGKYVDKDGKVIKDTELDKMVPEMTKSVNYSTQTTLAIEVVPVQKDLQFEVGKVSYALDLNFATVKSSLQTALDAVEFKSVVEADDRAEAKALRTRLGNLQKTGAGIQKDIESIVLDEANALWTAYTTYSLNKWAEVKPGDAISTEIAKLAGDAKTYNGDVDAENAIWNNIQTNKTALAALNGEVTALQTQLNNKKAEIDNIKPESGKLGEYCKFITSADIAAAQTAIDNYKASIAAAYADLTKPVTFASQNDKISAQISAISYETAKNDWNAYGQFLKDVATVQNDYGKIFAQINDIKVPYTKYDNTKVDNVYDDVIGKANIDLTKLYDNNEGYVIDAEGGQTPDNPNIAGAAAKLADAQQEIADRQAAMNKVFTDLQSLVTAQDAQLVNAKAQIKDLEEQYDALSAITSNPAFSGLSAADQNTVKNDLAGIENALNALKAGTDKDYLAHELDVDGAGFQGLVTSFDNAVNKFNTDTQGFSGVLDLMISLEDAKQYVKKETSEKSISKYNLASKFDQTFSNIQEAIDGYYKNPTNATAKSEIETSIASSKTMCDNLVDAFTQAVGQINDAQKALDSFNKAIDAKVVVTVDGKAAYDKAAYKYAYDNNGSKTLSAASVAAALAHYDQELSEIAGVEKYANPNDAYAAAIEVSDEIVADDYATYVPKAETAFENTVTTANLNAVKAVAKDIKDKTTTEPYKDAAGMDKVSEQLTLPEGYDGSENVDEADAAVSAALGNAKDLAKCDADLVVLAGAYEKVYDQIQKVVANYDAWQVLLGNENVAQKALDAAVATIGNVTVEPAASFYTNEFDKLQDKLDGILGDINDSYTGLTEVADKANHVTAINSFKQEVKDLEKAMADNQKYYDDQVKAAKQLADDANRLIAWLEANDEVPANLKKYLDEIKGVTDELAAVNVSLTKDFGAGKSVDNNATYQDQFNDLRNKLQAIYDAETNGYKSAVEKANNDYLISQGIVEGALDKQYDNAIAWVNAYRYDISNPGYYSQLVNDPTFKKNHEDLQQCYKRINDLEDEIDTFVAGLTAGDDRSDWTVLESNSTVSNKISLSDLIDEYTALKSLISTTLANIDAAAKTVADDYYTAQSTSAQTKYDSINDRLVDAGFSADKKVDGKDVPGEVSKAMETLTVDLSAAKNADKTLNDAITAAGTNTAKYNAAVHAYVLGMSGICDNLDKVNDVNANNFVKDAINSQWAANYKEASNTISGYITEAQKYTQDPGHAAAIQALWGCLEDVENLNSEWGRLTTAEREAQFGVFDNSNPHDNLEDLVSDAKTALDASKAAHENALKNNEALKVLLANPDSYLNETQKDLNALLAWSGYRDTQLAIVAGLQTQVNNVVTLINGDANVNASLNTYKADFTNIQTNIENAYETVFNQEKTFAQQLLLQTRSAFNNAKKAGANTEVLNKYDAQIKELTDALDAVAYDADDKDGCRGDLFAIEDQLCAAMDVLEELGRTGSVKTDSCEAVLAELNEQYNAINGEITALQNSIASEGASTGSYGQAVASEFGPKAETLASKLAGYKAGYEADGANVISSGDEYAYMMEQLEGEYTALKAAWEPEQKEALKKYTSDTCYDALIAELNRLDRQTMFAHEQAFKFGGSDIYEDEYQKIITLIHGQKADSENGTSYVEGEREKLADMKKNFSITKSTKLNPEIEAEVNVYVPNELSRVAGIYVGEEYNHLEGAINGIKYPGENEKGWKISFHNVAEILADLENEGLKIDKINTRTILEVPDPEDPDRMLAATPEQAIETYEGIVDNLDNIATAIDGIVESAQEEKYIKGDIDEDGDINVIDVQKLISFIGEEVELDGKTHEIYNVNSDDAINVADVTALINMMMSNVNGQMRVRSYLGATSGSNSIRVEEVAGNNGLRRFAVVLNNEVEFAAGQLDIVLPEHARVAGVSLGERASALDAYVFENAESTRVIITSLENDLITGNNGCVLFIDVEGNAEVEIEDVVFSDINGNAYTFGNSTSGVDNLYESIKNGVKAIYNAAGQKINKLTRGVNIIRNADGSVTKKIGK